MDQLQKTKALVSFGNGAIVACIDNVGKRWLAGATLASVGSRMQRWQALASGYNVGKRWLAGASLLKKKASVTPTVFLCCTRAGSL
jgi:hypothetical protein